MLGSTTIPRIIGGFRIINDHEESSDDYHVYRNDITNEEFILSSEQLKTHSELNEEFLKQFGRRILKTQIHYSRAIIKDLFEAIQKHPGRKAKFYEAVLEDKIKPLLTKENSPTSLRMVDMALQILRKDGMITTRKFCWYAVKGHVCPTCGQLTVTPE